MSSPAKLCAIQHQSMIQLRLYRSSSNYINSISDFFPKSHRRVAPPLPQPPSSKAQPTAESFTTGSTTRSSTHRKLRRIKRPTSSSLTFNFRTHSRAPLQFDPALNVTGNCCSSVHQRSCLLPLSSSRPWIVAERVSQFIAISVSVIYFSLVAVAREAIGPPVMEESKSHFHYNHTDPCNLSRWNARESFEFMHARPWRRVSDFYSDLVRGGGGSSALSVLFPPNERQNSWKIAEKFNDPEEKEQFSLPTKERSGRWERATFKIVLSYHGDSFDGWQRQPCLNTVQGVVEKSLGRFVDEDKAQQLKDKSLPVEGCAVVAGRTDKGVTALQQVCSFYTWRKDVKSGELKAAIDEAAPGMLRALSISEVSRSFHPNFSAKWRRYFYIFPLVEEQEIFDFSENECSSIVDNEDGKQLKLQNGDDQKDGCLTMSDGNEKGDTYNSVTKPRSFNVAKVDRLLRQLEGKTLSYKMFARDTKASRSTGPPTECFMFHARACETSLPSTDQKAARLGVMCVELIANRFLRKMVRVLVATAIREAAAGSGDDSLVNLMDATCRRATAPPAPPDGLCLVDVGYTDFCPDKGLIL